MFNHVVAMLLGVTAFILSVVALFRMDLLDALAYDERTTPEYRAKDVYDFLNEMDDTRSSRYNDRSRMLPQYDGYRHAWYGYQEQEEIACNMYESYECV